MRRVLIALFFIASFALVAAPAAAQDVDGGEPSTAQTPDPVETTPPPDTPTETPTSGESPSPSASPSSDGSSGPSTNKSTGPDETNGPGGGPSGNDGGGELCAAPAPDTVTTADAAAASAETAQEAGAVPTCEPAALIEISAKKQKVDICHSTSSNTNPYNVQHPSADGDVSGHADHGPEGGVFPDDPWGDIIPPFDFGPGAQFDGLNWTAEGQAIYFNNCNLPGDDPEPEDHNVTICHATGSQNNPYSSPNPSVTQILEDNGHAEHGPDDAVFPQDPWGDIIPPFDFGQGASFGGLNWNAEGQAIYFNNCNVPGGPGGGDDDDDDGDDDDGDDEDKGSLPDTGGQSPVILLIGGLLTVFGIAILSGNGSMGRMMGSVGPVPSGSWSYPTGRHLKK